MRKFTNEDIKRVGLEILLEVHKYCVENNLKYSLGYGTLLGAIRHKGYIPWDDDIDLIMPRKDYEYFVSHFNNDNYGVYAPNNNPKYAIPFAKVFDKRTLEIDNMNDDDTHIGYNIDIFPLDEFESLKAYQKSKKKEARLLKKYIYCIVKVNKGVDHPLRYLLFKFMYLFYGKKGNKYSNLINTWFIDHNKKDAKNTVLVGNEVYLIQYDYAFPINIFDELIEVDFEGHKLLAIKDYDAVLTACYGDYMTPPPEKERESTHGFEAYFLN